MTNLNEPKLFYRFRHMEALLKGYNELENEYLYFSSTKELNDPLEGYMDIDFKGDKIIWTNFFKNYIFSLFTFLRIFYLSGNSKELTEDDIHVRFNSEIKDLCSSKDDGHYKIACDEILSNKLIKYIIENYSIREMPITKNELNFILVNVHIYILSGFNKIDVDKGILNLDKNFVNERLDFYLAGQDEIIKSLEKLKEAKDFGEKEREIAIFMEMFFNNNAGNLPYSNNEFSRSDEIRYKNFSLLINYPKIYLNKLDEIMYLKPYVACFSDSYNDLSMWGYYADSSKGACLIFKSVQKGNDYYLPIERTSSLNNDSINVNEIENFDDMQLKKVEYSKQMPTVPFFRSLGRETMPNLKKYWYMLDDKISKTVEDILDESGIKKWREEYWERIDEQINTKQENWAHEREYRISLVPLFDDTYDTKEKRRLRYKFDNLEGLIFGINASEENKLNVKKILLDKCKKHNRKEFKMYQAIYNNVTGKIDIIPIIFNLQG